MWLPLIMVLGYVLIVLFIGVYAHRFLKRSPEDYFIASRTLGVIPVFASAFFVTASAWAILGVPGAVFKLGVGFYYFMVSGATGMTLLILLGYKLWRWGRKYHYITPGDFFADRFGSKTLQLVIGIMCLWFMICYVGLQCVGVGKVLQATTHGLISYRLGAIIGAAVIMVYLFLGGVRAHAWTNILQGAILFIVIYIVTFSVIDIGFKGATLTESMQNMVNAVMAKRPKMIGMPGPVGAMTFLNSAISIGVFATLIGFLGWPHLISRYFSAKDPGVFKKMLLINPIAWVLLGIPQILLALMAVGLLGPEVGKSVEAILPAVSMKLMPPVITGFVAIAIFAVAMSTADGQQIFLTSVITRDIYTTFINPKASDERIFKVARVILVVSLICSLLLAFAVPSLVVLMMKFIVPGLGLFSLPLLFCFWRRTTKAAQISSLIVGMAIVIFTTLIVPNPFGINAVIWAYSAQAIILFVVTLATKPPEKERVDRFFAEEDKILLRKRIKQEN